MKLLLFFYQKSGDVQFSLLLMVNTSAVFWKDDFRILDELSRLLPHELIEHFDADGMPCTDSALWPAIAILAHTAIVTPFIGGIRGGFPVESIPTALTPQPSA